MNKTIKKIIAREGLIFLGIIVCCIVLGISLGYLGSVLKNDTIDLLGLLIFPPMIGFWTIYALYLLIRFIFWAIRTLRGK